MVGKYGLPYTACEIDATPGTWQKLLAVLEYAHDAYTRHGRGRYRAVMDTIERRDGSVVAVDGHEHRTLWVAMAEYKFGYRDTDRIDRWFRRAECALVEARRAARGEENARCTDSAPTARQTELTDHGETA